jgi:hypothetical protein
VIVRLYPRFKVGMDYLNRRNWWLHLGWLKLIRYG